MQYEFDLAVPASTPATAPVSLEAALSPGVVRQVSILFPTGCAGLVHAYITRSGHQVWPTNLGAHFNGNGEPITWPEDYNLDDLPFGFTCYAYSLDDTYPHTVSFRFAVLASSRAPLAVETVSLLDRLRQLIGV